MHRITLIFWFALIITVKCQRHPNGCDIDIVRLKDPEPIFFSSAQSNEYQFIIPECGILSFKHGEYFYTACDKFSYKKVQCYQGNFYINGQHNTIDEVTNCKNIYPQAVLEGKGELCPQGDNIFTQLLTVGFFVTTPTSTTSLKLYEICHNFTSLTPLYVHYLIHGQTIMMKMSNVTKKMDFRRGSMITIPMDASKYEDYYKYSGEKMRNILGKQWFDFYQMASLKFSFAKGHLARSSDFILTAWKRASYLLENIMPQWGILNSGVWNRVENAAQQIALYQRATVDVYVIGTEVLSLIGKNGEVPIYLGDSKTITAPKFIHKIIQTSQRFYHFVISNCPFYSDNKKLCTEYICPEGDDFDTLNEYIKLYDRPYNELGFIKSCRITSINDVI